MLFDLRFKFNVSNIPATYGPFALLTSGDDVEVTSQSEKERAPPSLGSGCVPPGVLSGSHESVVSKLSDCFPKKKKKSSLNLLPRFKK